MSAGRQLDHSIIKQKNQSRSGEKWNPQPVQK
jgi:hypothetical protein